MSWMLCACYDRAYGTINIIIELIPLEFKKKKKKKARVNAFLKMLFLGKRF